MKRLWILDHLPQHGLLVGDEDGEMKILTWGQMYGGIKTKILNDDKPIMHFGLDPAGYPEPTHVTLMEHGLGGRQIILEAQTWGIRFPVDPYNTHKGIREIHVRATYHKPQQQWLYWGFINMGVDHG